MNPQTDLKDVSYREFCKSLDLKPVNAPIDIASYSNQAVLSEKTEDERLTAALTTLLNCVCERDVNVNTVDAVLIDQFIARIDQVLSDQMDEILHHPDFQALESSWKSLAYLVHQTDFNANIKIECINVSKDALINDFTDAPDVTHSGLSKQIYEKEYDMPGGEPITAMITNFDFKNTTQDLFLLSNLAKVAASTHCPVIGAVEGPFFGKSTFAEVVSINELNHYMDRAQFLKWNQFRESEDARYVGLTCPKFLMRLPYGDDSPVKSFCYRENVLDSEQKYLWAYSSFAFAANMVKSFKAHGWAVNIRGPESGGKVSDLLIHQFDFGRGLFSKIPTESLIPETKELALANLGFIPLSYYKDSDFACFFSANSLQKPATYSSPEANANSRINSRLPYVFLSARIAHYLKVLQRETIGSNITRDELENRLNAWLKTLVTKMNHPDPEQIATHPLREGFVKVETPADNPGFYKVILNAMPHFQIEGVDVSLSIVGKMPKEKK